MMAKAKDFIFVFLFFLTPIIQVVFTWDQEYMFITKILGYPLFYSEIMYIILLLYGVPKLKHNGKNIIIISGLLISLISCILNYDKYSNWPLNHDFFLRFFIGADFYLYALVFSVISFSKYQLIIIKKILILIFIFISLQQILVPLGIIPVKYSDNFGGLIRYGTTAGSCIQSGYLVIMLMGMLFLFSLKKNMRIFISVFGAISVVFSLSRGPILSLFLILFLYLFIVVKKHPLIVISILIIGCIGYHFEEKKYGIFGTIIERNKEVNSAGRTDRWETTVNIYKKSSFILGWGNAITPNERFAKSGQIPNIEQASSPHNVYLSFLVENGIIGLINFIILLGCLIVMLKKRNIKISFSLLIFLSFFIILMNVEIILRNGTVAFFFWLYFDLLYNSKKVKLYA